MRVGADLPVQTRPDPQRFLLLTSSFALGFRRFAGHSRPRTKGVVFGAAIILLACALVSCAGKRSTATNHDSDQGTVILHVCSGGTTFWLFRNHDDGQGNVCYGFAAGAASPTQKIDSGGFCLDRTFDTMEADPITSPSGDGMQMAVGGAISATVSRVEVVVNGISHHAAIRHGFFFAAMAYGGFVVKAFDSHGKLLRELDRPAPPTGPPPTPVLTPPVTPTSS